MAMPEVRERLAVLGMQPAADTAAELAACPKSDIANQSRAVRDGGIRAE